MNSDQEIGGIPLGILCIKCLLPTNKFQRRRVVMVITLLVTYVTYMSFQASRRPIIVLQMKIVQECNTSLISPDVTLMREGEDWCKDTAFKTHGKDVMMRLTSGFLGFYGIFMFFSGCIADYFNPRYYLSTGCLFSAFFAIAMGLANLWNITCPEYFIMTVIMYAVAQSSAWPVLLSCATHWYFGKRIGLFFGVWNTHAYLGSYLGMRIAGIYIREAWGWSFIIPGIVLGFVTIFIFLFLVVHPSDLNNLDAPRKSIFLTDDSKVVPPWLNSWRSVDYYEVLKVPGVIEFSACMFFTRMVSYIFKYWLPSFKQHGKGAGIKDSAILSTPFFVGGIVGGILTGILKDMYKRSALICVCFLLLCVPAIALQMVTFIQTTAYLNSFLHFILGILVEGPYILLNTSVSVDLGSHGIIRRGHRGLATVAAIVEGCGALGAAFSPFAGIYFLQKMQWTNIILLMMIMECIAALCLARMAVKDYRKRVTKTNVYLNSLLHSILGILVEGPYIFLNTSVSVNLCSHGIIRWGHKGMATVTAIVEGCGALGAAFSPLAGIYFLQKMQWTNIILLMMIMECIAALCFARMAVTEK